MFWANTATGLCKHEPWMGGTYVLILAVQNVQAMSSPPATRVQNEHSFHKTNHTLLHAWLLNWYKNRERYRELQDKSNIWICFLWRWKPAMLPFAWQQDEPAEIRDSFLRRMMLRIVSWSTWEVFLPSCHVRHNDLWFYMIIGCYVLCWGYSSGFLSINGAEVGVKAVIGDRETPSLRRSSFHQSLHRLWYKCH